MDSISRRELFKRTADRAAGSGLLAAGLSQLRANPLGMAIACQTYPVRSMIAKDFPGTIQQLAAAGFQAIELCSPAGYKSSGFGDLAKYKGAELRKIIADAGLACTSSHFTMKELRDNVDASIAWAKDMQLTQMMTPTLSGPKNPTMDDVKRAADEFNKISAKVAQAGMQQGLHNEGFELTSIDGKRTYDILFELLDPKLVKFQFQCSTISQGFDAAEYFMKYPGRFISMHVQDWNAETKQIVAVGKGSLDWKKIFTAAKTGGLKNYFVEMNLDLMQASVPYLRSLKV